MMIDWLTFTAPFEHDTGPFGPFFGGEVFATLPDSTHPSGEVPDWVVRKRIRLVSSWSTEMQVRSVEVDGRRCVQVSGNPAKLLQGHNVFGSDNLPGLVRSVLAKVCAARGVKPSAADCEDWAAGRIRLQRVDVTRSVDLGSLARVRSAIRALETCGRLRHRGRGHAFDGLSITFGQGSRRWSMTFYAKGPELTLKAHGLPAVLAEHPELPAFADGLLRQELRLQSLELTKLGLESMAAWDAATPSRLHAAKLDAVEICEGNLMETLDLERLPPRLRAPYLAWKAGHDVRALYSRTRFYVYRRELLNRGVDIAVKQPEAPKAAPGVALESLSAIIKGPEAPVPAWAKGTELYFEPPAKRGRFG